MTDTTDSTITIRIDDEVVFRLHKGRRPHVYPDTVTRVSYEIGVSVLHIGTVWALGYLDEAEALELDDGTVVVVADIDPESFVFNSPTATVRDEPS
jgi:hypothetical protein